MLVYHAKSTCADGEPSGDPFDQALSDPLVVSRPQRHRGQNILTGRSHHRNDRQFFVVLSRANHFAR